MSTRIQNYYPSFVPNQVLTDSQLNELRSFLDEQGRLTRNRLIGTGIVCGLHANYSATEKKLDQELHVIALSGGLGITSEGYLLEMEPATFSQYRLYEGIDRDGDKTIDYPHWRDAKKPVYELVPDQADLVDIEVKKEPEKIFPLEEQYVRNHILVVYIEPMDESLKSCRTTDCSNKGSRIRLTVKVLLVHETDLSGIPKNSPLSARMIHIPRFHTALPQPKPEDGLDTIYPLSTITRTDDIRHAYGLIILKTLSHLRDVLDKYRRHDELRNFLQVKKEDLWEIVGRNSGDDPVIELLERLTHIFPEGKDASDYNQYHYDFIRDLVVGINEFEVAWCQLVQSCKGPSDFPRHLMVRRFESSQKPDGTTYRHVFQPSAVKNQMYQDWEKTRRLFLRILYMVGYFDAETVTTYGDLSRVPDIRITPGQTGFYPLGERAIPFYYNWQENTNPLLSFPEVWQPAMKCTPEEPLTFHQNPKLKPDAYAQNPLYFDLRQKSFFQIEGHIGKTPGEVMDFLKSARLIHNLDFDVVLFYLSTSVDELRDPIPNPLLYKDYVTHLTGMEHLSGVAPGDTLILLADPKCPGFDDDVVVADFTLKGKLSCCLDLESVDQTYYSEPRAKMEVHVFDEEKYYFGDATVELRKKGEKTVLASKTTPNQTKGDGSTREGIVSFEGLTEKVGYEITGTARKDNRLYMGTTTAMATAKGQWVELILYPVMEQTEPEVRTRGFLVEEEKIVPPAKTAKSEEITEERRQSRVKVVFAMNKKGDYQRNRTYQSVQEFISDDKLQAATLTATFKDTLGKLKSVYKRADGQKEQDYRQMIELVFLAYLDRLVETTPTSLPSDAREVITAEIEVLSEYGQSGSALKKTWNAPALKKSSDANIIEQINRLLK
ncbi:MAG: hypothetical protein SF052_05155 [Bacteroidia bacterium]|nr:hypothetical protein [Bacteroidia bacterium]